MLDYARLLTLAPAEVTEAHVQALRGAGFDDAAIGEIVLITAMYAMMNRLVDGTGESLSPDLAEEAERLGLKRRAAGVAD